MPFPALRPFVHVVRRLAALAVVLAFAAACTAPRTPATPAAPTASAPAASPSASAIAAPSPQAAAAQPAGDQGGGIAFAMPPKPLTLPADAAPHTSGLEWWYYTGHLEATDGRKFGYQFVMFQRASAEAGKAGYVAHAAITDVSNKKFTYAEKLVLAPVQQSTDSFSLKVDDWAMKGKDGDDQISFTLDGYALDLTLKAIKPPVLHGGTGYIAVGEKEFSYYYSRPRMAASGELTVGTDKIAVRGSSWFDQQWGDMTLQGGGWDWFGIQLDDRSDLMVSHLRGADGKRVALYGTYVGPDGKAEHLAAQDIQLQNGGLWISPRTGGRYPMGWSLRVPKLGLDLAVQPDLQDQELDTTDSTEVIYWEGKSTVQGFGKGGAPVTGLAYVELTNYAKKNSGQQGTR